MKSRTLAIAASFFLASSTVLLHSCSSFGGMSVPGESDVIIRNIVTEYMNIAKAYDDLKKYDRAVEYYHMAIRVDVNGTLGNSAHYRIAHCYAMARDWKNARKVYAELLKSDADNTNVKISIAYLDAMSGDLETACSEYSELCRENPTDAALLKNYISVLVAAKRVDESQEAFALLNEKFPDDTSLKEIKTAVDALKSSSEDKASE